MLPKIPNRKKIYYKITNQKENHRGLQYRDGLIIDSKKFNDDPEDSCIEGGIYFTTKEYIHRFFGYGQWIRLVKIPLNAKVILDPSRDKYRADRLFFKPRKNFNFYFDELFNKKTFPEEEYWRLAKYCSKYFDKWFDKKTFPKEDYWYLAKYCSNYFTKWFDKKTFPEEEYKYLAEYCSKYFDKWFDKKTFPKKDYWYLVMYCSKYKYIWNK